MENQQSFWPVQRIWKSTPEYYLNPWQYYVDFITILKARGAKFITFSDALAGNYVKQDLNILLDHHIDHYPIETELMCCWEAEAGVISNVFLFNRVTHGHAVQVQRWGIEDLNIPFYQELERSGFEIGYHQNAVGQVRQSKNYDPHLSKDDTEKAQRVFARDIDNLRKYFNIRVFIPHGGGEGNAHLTELPPGYGKGLSWVYNNAPEDRPVTWENYTDSCGQTPQVVKGYQAQYVLHIDNLHLKAHLCQRGLHHILVHSGRFGKGMPYERYLGAAVDESQTRVQLTFDYPTALFALPVRSSRMIEAWEGERGKHHRLLAWNSSEYRTEIPRTGKKYYLLTDQLRVLRMHMAQNDLCIPVLSIYAKFSNEAKQSLKRQKKESAVPISFPVPPDDASHLDQGRIDRLFQEQFLAFYNLVYSDRLLLHLATADLRYDCLHLWNLEINKTREISELLQVLDRYRGAMDFVLRVTVSFPRNKWIANLNKAENSPGILASYQFAYVEKPKASIFASPGFILYIRSVPAKCDEAKDASTPEDIYLDNYDYIRDFKGTLEDRIGIKIETITTPFQIYDYAAKFIRDHPVTEQDLKLFRSKGLPSDFIEAINPHHGDRSPQGPSPTRYSDYINARPHPEVLYSYLQPKIGSILAEAKAEPDYRTVQFAWGWAYTAEISLMAYAATGDRRFLDLVTDSFDYILACRDSELGIADQTRARTLKAWGSSYFTDYARKKGYLRAKNAEPVWSCNVVTTGRIAYPALLFCRQVKAAKHLLESYSGKAQIYLQVIQEAVNEFLGDFRELKHGMGYFWRVERNEVEPLNHQNTFGKSLILLSELTGYDAYREIAMRLARYFKSEMRIDENDALVWGYKGSCAGPVSRSQEIEDIGHGNLNMQFALVAHQHGIVFDEGDMRRLSNTFTRNIYRGDCQFIGGLSPKRENNVFKDHYSGHLLNWIVLSPFNPAVRQILERAVALRYDLYPGNWFTNTISPIAYACRLLHPASD